MYNFHDTAFYYEVALRSDRFTTSYRGLDESEVPCV